MGRVPELGRDEELLALDDARDDLLQRRADLVLVLVHGREVKVAVAVLNSVLNLLNSTSASDEHTIS